MLFARVAVFFSTVTGVVANVLHKKAVELRSSACGEPTNYRASGCWRVSKVFSEETYNGNELMSIEECFGFCALKKGAKYFGVSEGKKCWCGSIWRGSELGAKTCDDTCQGNALQTCGGTDATNVFVMYDCTKDTPAETNKIAEAKRNDLLTSYGAFTEQTCGTADGGRAKIDGSETKVGTVDDCKLACWAAPGAETCHGFTYDEGAEKCTFHQDVLDGEVVYKPRTTCYFKKI